MGTITCPKCGTVNPANTMNCMQCRINLQWALHDHTETLVAQAPQRGQEAIPSETELAKAPTPLWVNRRAKIKMLLLLVALVFICTLPILVMALAMAPTAILLFPCGLFFVFGIEKCGSPSYSGIVLVWALYLTILAVIVTSSSKIVVRSLFVVLTVLLILNVVGCNQAASYGIR
jgi:hypothetical protein